MKLRRTRAGFTLAEVAVTIVIVGTMLIYLLQGLNGTKLLAAHTRNTKLARELALVKLGQIGSGLFQEEIDRGLSGSFADEGYPDFSYEVVVGDEAFRDKPKTSSERFDSWNPPDKESSSSTSESSSSSDAKDEDKVEQPFEKVKIRISFPKIQEFQNELVLEQWFPWTQVYGEKDDQKTGSTSGNAAGSNPGGSGTGSTGTSSGGNKP